MSELTQSGAASHLSGAAVIIQEAGRHFGKIAQVVGRSVHRKEHQAFVRVSEHPRQIPFDRRQPWRGYKTVVDAVTLVLPDDQLTRTPDSLTLPKVRQSRLGGLLSAVCASAGQLEQPARRKLTQREYDTRNSRRHMAEASRKRNGSSR